MRRLALTASLALVVLVSPAVPQAKTPTHSLGTAVHATYHCRKTYTVAMVRRAVLRVYAGTRLATRGDEHALNRYVRCTRSEQAFLYASGFRARQHAAWEARRHPPALSYGTASWYNDGGATASGFHAFYGVAACGSGGGPCLPFGTRVQFYYHGRHVTAIVDDHGPYVSGRAWDLNQNTAAALGFGGVDTVGYSIG